MTITDIPKTAERSGPGSAALFLGAALLSFALFVLFNAWKPASSDEHWFLIAADNYARSGSLAPENLIHPPLYTLVNGSLLKIYKTPAALKLWGGALGLGSMGLMFLLGRACGAGRERSALAALLMGLAPLFIQGSLLLDTDNTLVVFSLLAMLLALLKERWLFFCAAFLLCLWSKLTASLPILAVFAAWGTFDVFGGRRRGALLLVSLAAGLALFLVSFASFCAVSGLPFGMPFDYIYATLFSKRITGGGGGVLLQVLQFSLWAGLPFCFLWLTAAARAAGSGNSLDRLALLFSAVIGAGYFFLGGTPFGFPKFQIPAFVLGCWLVSGPVAEAVGSLRNERALAAGCFLAGTAAVAAAGDPLYTLRFLVRGALAAGQGAGGHLTALAAQAVLPAALAAVFWFLLRKTVVPAGQRVIVAAGLACFCQFTGMDLLQVRPHNTLYTYGATGILETVALTGAELGEGGQAALPLEIAGYLRLKGADIKTTRDSFWSDPEALKAAISDPGYRAIIYGVPFNTIGQIKVLTSADTAAALAAGGWGRKMSGSYQVWTRRGGGNE